MSKDMRMPCSILLGVASNFVYCSSHLRSSRLPFVTSAGASTGFQVPLFRCKAFWRKTRHSALSSGFPSKILRH